MLARKGIFTPCINTAGARQCAKGEARRLAQQDFLRILYHKIVNESRFWANFLKNKGAYKMLCDGLGISLSDFFDTEEFKNLEQKIL